LVLSGMPMRSVEFANIGGNGDDRFGHGGLRESQGGTVFLGVSRGDKSI
jgi:hypothetical protein